MNTQPPQLHHHICTCLSLAWYQMTVGDQVWDSVELGRRSPVSYRVAVLGLFRFLGKWVLRDRRRVVDVVEWHPLQAP